MPPTLRSPSRRLGRLNYVWEDLYRLIGPSTLLDKKRLSPLPAYQGEGL